MKFLRRKNDELDEEIRFHINMAEQERIARGETPEEARRNARREFGNELLTKEVTRQMWTWVWLERFAQDIRYAFRQMKANPGFTATAILTLGLGLGAITAMFSIVNGVLLEPLGFTKPGELFVVRAVPPPQFKIAGDFPVNGRIFHEWRDKCQSCENIALAHFDYLTMVGLGQPEKLPALSVSYNFFRTLGVQPVLGRDFLRDEEHPPLGDKVILTDQLWRTRFAADPQVMGRKLQLNGETYTVIGVMPPTLHLPQGEQWGALAGPPVAPLIFKAFHVDLSKQPSNGEMNYVALVRGKPGLGARPISDELKTIITPFQVQNHTNFSIGVFPLARQMTRNARSALWFLLATVAAVLLIVCINVGNLMLVRASSRTREAGIRIALGAGRGGIFGLVLREALVLVTLGGMLGLLLAQLGVRLLVLAAPPGVPRIDEVHIDWRVMAFAGAAVLLATLVCGLLPAWRLSRTEPQESLKAASSNSTATGSKLRIREILAGLEVALSTIVLIAGGLLLMSFLRVLKVERGFETVHVITQDVSFLAPKYAKDGRRYFVEDIIPKLAQIPGVEVAGGTTLLPLRGEDWLDGLESPDAPPKADDEILIANFRFVTPGYFQAMGIRLIEGRFLDASDKNQFRVVISESAAKRLWPGRSALGRRVGGTGAMTEISTEVVGVVSDVPAGGLDKTPPYTIYEHYWRMQPINMSFVLRTRAEPEAVIGSLHRVLRDADPEMALPATQTMDQIIEESLAVRRFQMELAGGFAIAALLLASLGIYGIISFGVARRISEIGIRMALGAKSDQVVGMILKQGMLPVIVGLVAGLAGAWFAARLLATQLFGITVHDPITIGIVTVMLALAGLASCWIPARRAARIDPLRALRFE
jgi:predicted permease